MNGFGDILGLFANVREILELPDVIEWAQFSSLRDTSRERSYRAIYYHSGMVGEGADFIFHDPCKWHKSYQHASTNRASDTRVVLDDSSFEWFQEYYDIERTPHDDTR